MLLLWIKSSKGFQRAQKGSKGSNKSSKGSKGSRDSTASKGFQRALRVKRRSRLCFQRPQSDLFFSLYKKVGVFPLPHKSGSNGFKWERLCSNINSKEVQLHKRERLRGSCRTQDLEFVAVLPV